MDSSLQDFARQVIETEATAVKAMVAAVDGEFEKAVRLIVNCKGSLLISGIGKAGHVARKLSATFSSTGTPSHFLSPADAVHGDLGSVRKGDVLLLLSSSGESDEILRLLNIVKKLDHPVIGMTAIKASSVGRFSDVVLAMGRIEEACPLGLAPSASTTAMLALGDALAVAVSLRKGFRAEDFADLHPGGKLGKKLKLVRELMHAGEAIPAVSAATAMTDVIYEMSRKKLGLTTVQGSGADAGRLLGVISDGDLRRLLEREGGAALGLTAGEAMNADPRTIGGQELAARALAELEDRKITSLVVVDGEGRVEGVLHLHDLWGMELI
jgi:arabinose-5-phosphate isomerase